MRFHPNWVDALQVGGHREDQKRLAKQWHLLQSAESVSNCDLCSSRIGQLFPTCVSQFS